MDFALFISILSLGIGLHAWFMQKNSNKRQIARDVYDLYQEDASRLTSLITVDENSLKDEFDIIANETQKLIISFARAIGSYLRPMDFGLNSTDFEKRIYVSSRLKNFVKIIDISKAVRSSIQKLLQEDSHYLNSLSDEDQYVMIKFMLNYSEIDKYIEEANEIFLMLKRDELNSAISSLNKFLLSASFLNFIERYRNFYGILFNEISKSIPIGDEIFITK